MHPVPQSLPARLPADLLEAAALGARFETRRRCQQGQDSPTLRRELLDRIAADLRDEGYGEPAVAHVLAECSRSVDLVLAEFDGPRRRSLMAAN